jgi:hypothetical protein
MTAPSTSAHVTPGRIAAKATCWAATVWSKSRRISSVGGPMISARSSSAL